MRNRKLHGGYIKKVGAVLKRNLVRTTNTKHKTDNKITQQDKKIKKRYGQLKKR
jgi:hypothetical protein